jgi:hypothetical protein
MSFSPTTIQEELSTRVYTGELVQSNTYQWPADSVFYPSWMMLSRINFPQFFQPNCIRLWLTFGAQVEFFVNSFGQVAMATLGKDCAFSV